jgi:hypothetical protein
MYKAKAAQNGMLSWEFTKWNAIGGERIEFPVLKILNKPWPFKDVGTRVTTAFWNQAGQS